MTRRIVLGVAALVLFALGIVAANTRIAQGVIPVTPYEADVNKDAHVNVADLGHVASRYGKPVPTATPTPSVRCDLSGRTFPEGRTYEEGGSGVVGPFALDLRSCRLVATQFRPASAIAPRVDLSSSTFRSSDLTDANFDGALLNSTDFSYANLTRSTFRNLEGEGLPGEVYAGSALFVHANLTDAVLMGNFTNADFTGATTTGTDASGVVWSTTRCPDGTNSDDNGGSCIGHGFAGTPLPTWTPTNTPTATATPDPCVGGAANAVWTAGNGHCYQRFDTAKVFADARSDCGSRGGYLVTLTTAEENAFVWFSIGASESLIGLTDEATEGVFLWVTGESNSFTNWDTGEPNDGYGAGEDAVTLAVQHPNGSWNDSQTNVVLPYICETP